MAGFSGSGYVFGSSGSIRAMAIQPDGKIIVIGGSQGEILISRYLSDGRPDTTFGTSGKTATLYGEGRVVAVQSDGKIVIAGESDSDSIVARYTSSGVPDDSFGSYGRFDTLHQFGRQGYATADAGLIRVAGQFYTNPDGAYALAIQPDGRIVAAGEAERDVLGTGNLDASVIRFTSGGVLDTSFSDDGIQTLALRSGNDKARVVLLQSDSKILVAGTSGVNFGSGSGSDNDTAFTLARLTSSGTLDTSFGTGGRTITLFNQSGAYCTSAAVQADGKILLAGYSPSDGGNFLVCRYTATGAPDTSFGAGGTFSVGITTGSQEICNAIAVQSDGSIMLVGSTSSYDRAVGRSNSDIALVRLTSTGALDTSFGVGGGKQLDFGYSDSAYSVISRADGKLILGGSASGVALLIRLNKDGSFDTSGPISGTSQADVLTGTAGNDSLFGDLGNDVIEGGAGLDIAIYSGARASYTVSKVGQGYQVIGPEGTDSLSNVERLQFSNSSLALDISGNAGQAYRLYQAAFNRTPDQGGLGLQMNALDTGLDISQVAANFIASPEFSATYGNLDNTQFVNQLYQNVLHRAADAAGLSFHTGNLASGANSRANVLVGFSESSENQAALIGSIQNGIAYTF